MGAQRQQKNTLEQESLTWSGRETVSRRNRRQSRRHRTESVSVSLIEAEGEAVPFECFDLSNVGLYIHSNYLLCPGERVRIEVGLSSRLSPLLIEGEVVRAEMGDAHGLTPGMGIAFREISSGDRAELERFLARRMRSSD